jgi:hypothetical protein
MEQTIGSLEGDIARRALRGARLKQVLLGAGMVLLGVAALAWAAWSFWGLDAAHIVARNLRKAAVLAGLALVYFGVNKIRPGALERLAERLRRRRGGAGTAALPSQTQPAGAADDTALVRAEFPKIQDAANELLSLLPDDKIKPAIALAAELAGLRLLRAGGADLAQHEPGSLLLGAVADDDYLRANRFLRTWAFGRGLVPPGPADLDLPDEDRAYYPEVARLEAPFDDICRRSGLLPEHDVYAALTAAMKIVAAGKTTGLLDERTGQALALTHFLTGSKTVPSPA